MHNSTPTPPPASIATRAAENGLVISGCILALLLLSGISVAFPAAGFLIWLGSMAMPVVLYKLLARSHRREQCSLGFAEIWAEGIASFFLGTLVPALAVYLLLKYAYPDFIANQVDSTIEYFRSMGNAQGDQWVKTLSDIQARSALPTAADVAANIISFNIIVGTTLSLLVTPFVKLRNRCASCATNHK